MWAYRIQAAHDNSCHTGLDFGFIISFLDKIPSQGNGVICTVTNKSVTESNW